MTNSPTSYGALLDSESLIHTLAHIFQTNLSIEKTSAAASSTGRGKRPSPVCIWGAHGIGKTSVVKDIARTNGWKFSYCAPAQFEEMGDLHGLPTRLDPDLDKKGNETTVYMPPDWVPRVEDIGPGILLLDDINRADERILRGIMQLLQEFELFSWSLPPQWQIVCTANPEGIDYSVTPMDDAMLTRLLHMTMVFDVSSWARWALNNGIDERGISFVLTYPEVITGKRTTPRTLTQFFDQIASIKELRQELELVNILARSALDDITATTFVAYVNEHLEKLIEPLEILDATDWPLISERLKLVATGPGDSKRVDRITTICTRLYLELSSKNYQPKPWHGANLVEFLLHPDLPNDLRFSMHRDLVTLGGEITTMLRHPKLAKAILSGL